MADRTVKMMGSAYATSGSVSIDCSFNGTQVHSGDVITENTVTEDGPTVSLFEFQLDQAVTGPVPTTITVTGGDAYITAVSANYSKIENNPLPVTADKAAISGFYRIQTVGTTDFVAMGAEDNTVGTTFEVSAVGTGDGTLRPIFEVVTADQVVADFEFMNTTNESKLNIKIDGVEYETGNKDSFPGCWHILVKDGETMTCDFETVASPTA
jgi:hypothetical protein